MAGHCRKGALVRERNEKIQHDGNAGGRSWLTDWGERTASAHEASIGIEKGG